MPATETKSIPAHEIKIEDEISLFDKLKIHIARNLIEADLDPKDLSKDLISQIDSFLKNVEGGGSELETILNLFKPQVRTEVSEILKQLKNIFKSRLDAVSKEIHLKFGSTIFPQIFAKFSEEQKTLLSVVNTQFKNKGDLGIQVSWEEFQTHIKNRFSSLHLDLQGSIRIMPGFIELPSTDLSRYPQLQQAALIVVWSGTYKAPCAMLKVKVKEEKNEGKSDTSEQFKWVRIMVSEGVTKEQYQAFYDEHFIPNKGKIKEDNNLGDIPLPHTGREEKIQVDPSSVIKSTLQETLPLPVATLLPEDSFLVSHSNQSQAWFDTIVTDFPRCIAWTEGRLMGRFSEDGAILHTSDKRRDKESVNFPCDQFILHIPQKHSKNRFHAYVTSAFKECLNTKERSWEQYICSVPEAKKEHLVRVMRKEVESRHLAVLNTETKKEMDQLREKNEPVYSISTVAPFANSNIKGILMSGLYYSERHDRHFLIKFGMPLTFPVQASPDEVADLKDFIVKNVEPLLNSPKFQNHLDELVKQEKVLDKTLPPASNLETLHSEYLASCTRLIHAVLKKEESSSAFSEYKRCRAQLAPYIPLAQHFESPEDILSRLSEIAKADISILDYIDHKLKENLIEAEMKQFLEGLRKTIEDLLDPKPISYTCYESKIFTDNKIPIPSLPIPIPPEKSNRWKISADSNRDSTNYGIVNADVIGKKPLMYVMAGCFRSVENFLGAAWNGNLESIKEYISKEHFYKPEDNVNRLSRVHVKDRTERTALHLAALRGHMDIVKFLVEECKASYTPTPEDPKNCLDALDETPLHLAVRGGKHEVIQYLVEAKADMTALNKLGETPLDLAYRLPYEQRSRIVPLLTPKEVTPANFMPETPENSLLPPNTLSLEVNCTLASWVSSHSSVLSAPSSVSSSSSSTASETASVIKAPPFQPG